MAQHQQEDYYRVLGVDRGASGDDIKRAFRQLARANHPDANQHDEAAEERFKQINEAYHVLSDREKRSQYDRYGHAGVNGPGGGPGPGFGGGIEDLFEAFFGGFGRDPRATAAGPRRGADLELSLDIELSEAARGLEREVEISRVESCHICGGNGVRPGSRPQSCPQCHGTGQVTMAQTTMFGRVMTSRPCDRCGGRGNLITDPCPECDGRGLTRRERRVNVRIPAGVPNQTRLRLSGQGHGGLHGGPPGDLYVLVRVRPDPRFERQGNDIVSHHTISYVKAALGGSLPVQTLWSTEEIELPAGTQPGDVFSLRGQGMPDVHGRGRGEHHVVVKVEIPTRLTTRQRELLCELARESGLDTAAAAASENPRSHRQQSREARPGTGGAKSRAGTASGGQRPRPARRAGRKKGIWQRVKEALSGEGEE